MPFREAPPTKRLLFTRQFPADPALDELVRQFERGDFRAVREGGKRLAADDQADEAVKRAARDLVLRTEADPLVKVLLIVAAALLVALTIYWEIESRGHLIISK